MFYTDDPVRDAENYMNMIDDEAENRPHIECSVCHGPIYKGDDDNYGDDYYELDDKNICECCIDGYLKDHKKECL